MEEKKTSNSSIDDRVTVSADSFVIKKSVPGGHSMTGHEFKTTVKLKRYKMFSLIDGIQLINRNDGTAKYYLVEDGTVFKYLEDSFSFYKLNLEDFVWESKQSLASIYFDTYLKFQELPDFEAIILMEKKWASIRDEFMNSIIKLQRHISLLD